MTKSTPNGTLASLEYDLLSQYHIRYSDVGFPTPEQFVVERRDASVAGRFTYFTHEGQVVQADGPLGLGTYSQFNMAGLDAGASFLVEVERGKVLYLEIAVNGNTRWDGSETTWSICDPDSGMFSDSR